MIKVISKIDCTRCEEVKKYLKENNIPFEVEMAEDKGYKYWREYVSTMTGEIGFPVVILFQDGENLYTINGSFENIVSRIEKWKEMPSTSREISNRECTNIHYDWAVCSNCGFKTPSKEEII